MVSDSESEYSDTEREGIDAKNIIKNKFMSHTCPDCCKMKSLIKQGFKSDVSAIICEYIQCDNCSYVLNTINRMKNRDGDIDIRNRNVDEDIEIYIFTLINKFPDDVDVLDRIFDGGDVEDRHINMIKRLYYEAFDEYTLYLSEVDFQYPILDVNFNLNVGELKWAFHRILYWIGWFHKPIGNSIYNKTTIDKIKRRIEDNVLRRL
jgi:hypothetical protein